MKDLISVIVPMYKVEKYLEKCIESIRNQTNSNLEIILVDDGSPDNCGRIADEYAKKDGRIKVVHKENGGISSARNAGLKIATGEYVIFVDSDDMISIKNCEILHDIAIKFEADIVMGKNIKTYEDEEGEIKFPSNFNVSEEKIREERIISHEEAYTLMLTNDEVGNFAHTKLYKRELFSNIEFPEGKVYEDAGTLYKVIHKANKIAYTDEIVYYYLFGRVGAITSSFSEKKILDSLEAYNGQYRFLRENYESIKDIINVIWVKMYTSAMEKICMNNYTELWNRPEVTDRYIDFKIAMDELNEEKLQKYLEPYRLISAVLLRHSREMYNKMFESMYKNKRTL